MRRCAPFVFRYLSTNGKHGIRGPDTVPLGKITHEIDQRLHTLDRHRVVDRRAHAADRAMALQCKQTRGVRFLEERLVELRARQRKRHVHPRTHRTLDWVPVVARVVDIPIQQVRFRTIAFAHRRKPALRLHPLEHEASEIPAPGIGRVQHRALCRMLGVVEDFRHILRAAFEQILAHDHHDQAGWADVLLRAGIQQRVLRDIERPRQDRRRHVADQRHIADIGYLVELDAADRLVGRDMDVGRIGIEVPLLTRRDAVVVRRGRASPRCARW